MKLAGTVVAGCMIAIAGCSPRPSDSFAIVYPAEASYAERLAAHEIRRYLYVRTGQLPQLVPGDKLRPARSSLVVVGRKESAVVQGLIDQATLEESVAELGRQQYLLKTIPHNGRPAVLVTGGDDAGLLYGCYRFAEHLGVRFYLHGDVIPDTRMAPHLPDLDERGKPLFHIRGINPWGSHSEGMDLWNVDDYKAIISQLVKLGMNFIGIHGYPEGKPFAEPLVWTGIPGDFDNEGRVAFSYPSSYFNTLRDKWGYTPKKTGDYSLGAAELFERDDWGGDVMEGLTPEPARPEDSNLVFNRVGNLLREAFRHAHLLGVKTAVGTETPLTIPAALQERLKTRGQNPSDRLVIEKVYQGMLARIMKTHPLDYFWLWTSEDWTWRAVPAEQVDAVQRDLLAAVAVAERLNTPFALGTAGWVLGPPQDRAQFDEVLPKEMPFFAISRLVGKVPLDPGFGRLQGRPKWAGPWLEDDPNLLAPQLWVGRVRKDARDALQYGCTGLIGLHWRTRILGPNVLALARAGWDHGAPARQPEAQSAARVLSARDFYLDWAASQFGPEAGPGIAKVFADIDSSLPEPSTWEYGGAGGLAPADKRRPPPADPQVRELTRRYSRNLEPPEATLEEAARAYAFIEQLEKLRSQVQGAGSLERFDYWLNSFRHMRGQMRIRYAWADYNQKVRQAKSSKDPETRRHSAKEVVLPAYRRLLGLVQEAYNYHLATLSNYGEIGTVMNWEQHTWPHLVDKTREELAALLGEAVPPDAFPRQHYNGPLRLIVPTVRTALHAGERLQLKVMILASGPPVEAALHWRPMGVGEFVAAPLEHVARGVYKVGLTADEVAARDLEYYIKVVSAKGEPVYFPATAPSINQTVVVTKRED